jgi:hypothetical protein
MVSASIRIFPAVAAEADVLSIWPKLKANSPVSAIAPPFEAMLPSFSTTEPAPTVSDIGPPPEVMLLLTSLRISLDLSVIEPPPDAILVSFTILTPDIRETEPPSVVIPVNKLAFELAATADEAGIPVVVLKDTPIVRSGNASTTKPRLSL